MRIGNGWQKGFLYNIRNAICCFFALIHKVTLQSAIAYSKQKENEKKWLDNTISNRVGFRGMGNKPDILYPCANRSLGLAHI